MWTANQAVNLRVDAAPTCTPVYTTVPATVPMTATAGDSDGTISKVEFYQGSTLLGTDSTSPYSYDWTGPAAGVYTVFEGHRRCSGSRP